MNGTFEQDILDQVSKMGIDQQRQVLNFARALAELRPVGVAGRNLLKFSGAIIPEDLTEMTRAINEGCERVNINEW
jgi:hypothetical protein